MKPPLFGKGQRVHVCPAWQLSRADEAHWSRLGSLRPVQPLQPGAVDARGDRAAQALLGVFLLAAFVFRLPWLVPVVIVVLLGSALLGPRANPLLVAFDR